MANWNGNERRGPSEESQRIAVLEAGMESLMKGQETIVQRIDMLATELTKYRGFAAGVVWVIGGIGAASIAIWEAFKDHFK
jgi:hypothetical protein